MRQASQFALGTRREARSEEYFCWFQFNPGPTRPSLLQTDLEQHERTLTLMICRINPNFHTDDLRLEVERVDPNWTLSQMIQELIWELMLERNACVLYKEDNIRKCDDPNPTNR